MTPGSLDVAAYEQDEGFLDRAMERGQAALSVHRPRKGAVVLGRSSQLEAEVHVEALLHDGLSLYRRRGGGCAVYLDPGTVVVMAAVPAPGLGHLPELFSAFSHWMIEGLSACGQVALRRRDVCDLVRDDRKVGGACLLRRRNWALYAVSLLVSTPIDALERYLRHPPREPAYRRGRPHGQFVATLGDPGRLDDAIRLEKQLGVRLGAIPLLSSGKVAVAARGGILF